MNIETMNINKTTTPSKSFEFRMKGYDPFVVQSIPELCDYISVFEPFAYFIIPNWAKTSEVGSKFIDPRERYEIEIIQYNQDQHNYDYTMTGLLVRPFSKLVRLLVGLLAKI